MLDSFTVYVRDGVSGHTFAMVDAVRADKLMNPPLDVDDVVGDPARDRYFIVAGSGQPSARSGGLIHGASSAGYFELHPRLWQGWCSDANQRAEPLPGIDERPLYGYAVVIDPSLLDVDGQPMGVLRNPRGVDITIVSERQLHG